MRVRRSAPLARRDARPALECAREIGAIGIADARRDLVDRQPRAFEQPQRVAQPDLVEQRRIGRAVFGELALERARRHMQLARDVVDRRIAAFAADQQVAHALDDALRIAEPREFSLALLDDHLRGLRVRGADRLVEQRGVAADAVRARIEMAARQPRAITLEPRRLGPFEMEFGTRLERAARRRIQQRIEQDRGFDQKVFHRELAQPAERKRFEHVDVDDAVELREPHREKRHARRQVADAERDRLAERRAAHQPEADQSRFREAAAQADLDRDRRIVGRVEQVEHDRRLLQRRDARIGLREPVALDARAGENATAVDAALLGQHQHEQRIRGRHRRLVQLARGIRNGQGHAANSGAVSADCSVAGPQ
ncbi:Uncharacterised protein [Clostridium sporogenes]|nr:Uncharacterised protein [Clostridium sporogenes]